MHYDRHGVDYIYEQATAKSSRLMLHTAVVYTTGCMQMVSY